MAIRYDIRVDDDLLTVVTSGFDESREEVEAYGMAVIAAAIEHQVARILCDERGLEYRLGTMDTFQAAKAIAENAPSVGRTALVCSAQDVPDAKFWTDVSRNRGLMVALFTDVGEARAWLATVSVPARTEE